MINSWSIPSSNNGKRIYDLPPLEKVVISETEQQRLQQQIREWDERLAALDDYKGEDSLKVIAGGYKETRLSPKGSLGLW